MTDWSSSKTISPPDIITLQWVDDAVNPPQAKEIHAPSTTSSDSLSTFETLTYTNEQGKPATQDVLITRVNNVYKTRASVNAAHVQARLKTGAGAPSGGVTITTTTTYEYTLSTRGPVLTRETTLETMPLYMLAGKLAIPQKLYETKYTPPDDVITAQKTIREHETVTLASGREMTRTLTSQWTCSGWTPEGQQGFANFMKAISVFLSDPNFDSGGLVADAVWAYSETVFQGTTVETGVGRAPVPTKPSDQDLIKDDVTNGNKKPLVDSTPIGRYGNTRNWPAFVLKALGDVAWQKYAKDSNNDGIPDWADFVPNDWTDYDTDSDGDGKPDWADFMPGPWADYQGDSNGDGVPDWADFVPVGWKDFSTADTDWTTTDGRADNSKTVKGIVLFDSEPYDPTNSTTTAVYEMRYAPDDHFEYVKGIRKLIPGAAEEAAKRFGLMESAIDVGHAYGQNIVTGWNEIPTLDMAPLYIRLAGVEGAFLMDSVSYAWGPDGMVVSSDLMLLGVSGYYGNAAPASSWLRLPFDPTQLQAAGALTTEASPVKANSITIPQGFDARDPGSTLAQLPTNGADVFRQWRSGERIMAPTLVWELLTVATGPLLIATEFEYALDAGSDVETPASGPVADFAWITRVDVPGPIELALAALAPMVSTGASAKVPDAGVGVAAAVPLVSTGAAVWVPVVDIATTGQVPSISTGAAVMAPAAEVAVTGLAPTVQAFDGVPAPAAVIAVEALAPVVVTGASVAVPAAGVLLGGEVPTVEAYAVALQVPAADVTVAALAPIVSTGAVALVPAVGVAIGALLPAVATGGAALVPTAEIGIEALTPDVVIIDAGGDYFSNMATQQYSALRDWLVDWWGD